MYKKGFIIRLDTIFRMTKYGYVDYFEDQQISFNNSYSSFNVSTDTIINIGLIVSTIFEEEYA